MAHRTALCRLLLIASAAMAMAPLAAATPTIGQHMGRATAASAALRNADGSDQLGYTVWYPSATTRPETVLQIGPPKAPLFTAGSAAMGAPVRDGRLPTVLLSHGNGGSALMMGWLGTALARAGYLVVAVDHPGNTGAAPITAAGSTLLWERAGDLAAALRSVQADPRLGPHVDTTRLAVAGFSAGGLTALLAAGARMDVERLMAFCDRHPDDGVCRPQAEAPALTLAQRREVLAAPALAGAVARATRSHAVPGIRAVVVLAPAAVQALPEAELQALRQPLLVISAANDDVAPASSNSDVVATQVPGARALRVADVGHYAFLAPCTDNGQRALGPLCTPAAEQARAQSATIEATLALLDSALR